MSEDKWGRAEKKKRKKKIERASLEASLKEIDTKMETNPSPDLLVARFYVLAQMMPRKEDLN